MKFEEVTLDEVARFMRIQQRFERNREFLCADSDTGFARGAAPHPGFFLEIGGRFQKVILE